MNEQPFTPPAVLDKDAPERKAWVKPEIQELDHELTALRSAGSISGDLLGYSAT